MPPYIRNEYYIKPDFLHTLSFMDEWKKVFDGKRFLFEYNLYTDYYFDPGYMSTAKIDKALALFDGIIDYPSHIEYEIRPYFDPVVFNQRIKTLF